MPTSRRRTTGALALVAALAASSAAALIEVPVSATAAPVRAQSAALTASTVGGPDLASTGVVVHLGPGATKLPPIHATTWLIADLTTGEVMAAKNAHKQMLPASTLKTLSVVSLMPRLDKNRVITATSREAGQIGSRVGLVSGATYTIWDLWNALLLPSANDAAMALADAYGGPAPTLALMKSEAKRLGAFDTTPRSPSGLDTPGQYSSAYDMALIARAAMQIPDFRTITMTTYYQFPGAMPKPGHKRSTYQLYTENRLLRHHYKGVAGGKTGYTTLARRTFWGAANRNGHLLVVTMFHIDDLTEVAATKLLDWGFANVGKVRPVGTLVQPAAADTVSWSVAKYDAQNPRALRELVASGTKFLPFPQPVMEACFNAANELYAETVAKNAKFKKVYEPWKQFRSEQVLWFRVVENTFDNFMARQSAANKL